ncbi:MAG: hypothetical protein NTV01_02150 [Bacteroidia bacterium]|nr:hypothetical protein [Bacteroidia bacterium]
MKSKTLNWQLNGLAILKGNSDYLVKKNIGRSTYKTEKYFRLIDETADSVIIPRGFVSALVHRNWADWKSKS